MVPVKKTRVPIGWAEYVDLPIWGIRRIKAKADTGARSSALHVENVSILPGNRVHFEVRLRRKNRDKRVAVEAPIVRRGRVKPSSGVSEARIFVRTTLRIGEVEEDIEVSLVDRENMIFRMLLGREALGKRFLVDPRRRYRLTTPLRTAGHSQHAPADGAPRKKKKKRRRTVQ